MKLAKWTSAAIAGAMMMAAPGAGAVVVLDQLSYVSPPPVFLNTQLVSVASIGLVPPNAPSPVAGMRVGAVQTITAGTKGKLSSVAFAAGGSSTGPLIVSLIDGDYAVGARSVVGQAYINVNGSNPIASPNNLNYIFDISSFNYNVTNGKKFSITFETSSNSTGIVALGTGYVDINTNTTPPTPLNFYFSYYGKGILARLVNGNVVASSLTSIEDMTFATYVDTSGAVPEPSTWSLLILGFGGIGAALRKQGRRWGKRGSALAA